MSLLLTSADNMTGKHLEPGEFIKEYIVELLHCTIPALHEIRKELPEELRKIKASSKAIAFSEILIDMVIEHKGNREAVDIAEIKLFPWFEETSPDVEKFKQKEAYFLETGLLPSEIILDSKEYLIDGYISYLLAKKHGIIHVPVRYGKRQIIKAYHKPGGKSYVWELPEKLIDQASPGDEIIVKTTNGYKRVTVAAVEEYGGLECAKPIKKAIRKIKCKVPITK